MLAEGKLPKTSYMKLKRAGLVSVESKEIYIVHMTVYYPRCVSFSPGFLFIVKRNILFAFGSLFKLFLENDVVKTGAFSLAAWNRQVSSNDYPSLDSLTKSIVKEKQPFVRLVMTKEELLEMFKVIRLSTRATFASDLAIFTSLALSCSVILLRMCM